mgnify:CR=1 FL=1
MANKGSYSQVGFSYDGDGKEEPHDSDGAEDDEDEDDEDDDEFHSDDRNAVGMESIAKASGVKRSGWLVYMDKQAQEAESPQKAVSKGDPALLSFPKAWL